MAKPPYVAVLTPHRKTAQLVERALRKEGLDVQVDPEPSWVEGQAAANNLLAVYVDRWFVAETPYRPSEPGSDSFKMCAAIAGTSRLVLVVDGDDGAALANKFGASAVLDRYRPLRKYVNPPPDLQYEIDVRRQWRILNGESADKAGRDLPAASATGFTKHIKKT